VRRHHRQRIELFWRTSTATIVGRKIDEYHRSTAAEAVLACLRHAARRKKVRGT